MICHRGGVGLNRGSTKKIALNGLMIALVFLVTYFTKIPGPVGPFNIGDAAIMVGAILLGRNSGFLAGAVGSALADVAMGYAFFSPITFVVKGLEGYIVGVIGSRGDKTAPGELMRIVAVVAGAVIMVGGYFLGEAYVLSLFDKTFGYVKAMQDLYFNIVQGVASAVVGYALSTLLARTGISRRIYS